MSDIGKIRFKERLEAFRAKRNKILQEYKAGATLSELAAKYGSVKPQAISQLITKAEKELDANNQDKPAS